MNVMTAKEEGKEPTAKEIAIESLLRAQKEGLPQTRMLFIIIIIIIMEKDHILLLEHTSLPL
jgi:hypothetical protein